MSGFRNAIFDFDMTLLDSIKPLMTSANLLAKEFGLPEVTYQEVFRAEVSVPNCTFEKLWEDLWGRCDPAWYPAYADHMTEAEYDSMELYEGAREVLEALRAKGIGLALASNRDQPRKIVERLGLESLFPVVIGQYDVERFKPAPDMILKAMELLGGTPDDTVYVGDAVGDIQAARAAGVRAVAMTTGGGSKELLASLGAWRTADKLSEILEML